MYSTTHARTPHPRPLSPHCVSHPLHYLCRRCFLPFVKSDYQSRRPIRRTIKARQKIGRASSLDVTIKARQIYFNSLAYVKSDYQSRLPIRRTFIVQPQTSTCPLASPRQIAGFNVFATTDNNEQVCQIHRTHSNTCSQIISRDKQDNSMQL